jgi:hypothetical protein
MDKRKGGRKGRREGGREGGREQGGREGSSPQVMVFKKILAITF